MKKTLSLMNNRQEIKRNYYFDIVKFISACMVVFLHIVFPGYFGQAVFSVARFAVPTFFAISGFFYNKTNKQNQMFSTKRKMLHILKILIASEMVMYVSELIQMVLLNHQLKLSFCYTVIIDAFERYARWRIISLTPLFNYSAWFLVQLIISYFLFYCFTRFNLLKTVRPIIVSFFIIGYLLVRLLPMIGIDLPPYMDYFILFMGLPFFAFGYYLKDYSLPRSFKSLYLLPGICLGIPITLLEAQVFSSVSLYLGSIMIMLCLMLICKENFHDTPNAQIVRILSYVGANLSLYIYILHSLVNKYFGGPFYYVKNIINNSFLSRLLDYLYPVYVLLATILISLLLFKLFNWIKTLKNRKNKYHYKSCI